jgi:type IV pilus assembly protein PilE
MRRQSGFTLIEIMIVVMIVAILAAIAIPQYHKYVVRSHRVDARRALLDLAGREEKIFYSTNTYTSTLADMGSDAATLAGQYYGLSIGNADAKTFTITASAVDPQKTEDPGCATLSITREGAQTFTGDGSASKVDCWGN